GTKLFPKFSAFDKAYLATLELGLATATGDCQGEIISKRDAAGISASKIEEVFNEFRGEINQLPPMFSALKYKGKKLYEWARRGIEVPREKRSVKIIDLKICDVRLPYVDFYVYCSKGTYVRTLANDIGVRLGCGACLTSLRRTILGPFSIDEAVAIDNVDESHIRHWPS
ncbi:MAG: tRNA pseudouridine(55) synthase TruB, partial [Candidatus Omnitrophica bacterium]|nr:tRNA pseudouridine(55) synthase TruB [Candidatus Omnitrophota bacterium]